MSGWKGFKKDRAIMRVHRNNNANTHKQARAGEKGKQNTHEETRHLILSLVLGSSFCNLSDRGAVDSIILYY